MTMLALCVSIRPRRLWDGHDLALVRPADG